jgi:hypothetical protein
MQVRVGILVLSGMEVGVLVGTSVQLEYQRLHWFYVVVVDLLAEEVWSLIGGYVRLEFKGLFFEFVGLELRCCAFQCVQK